MYQRIIERIPISVTFICLLFVIIYDWYVLTEAESTKIFMKTNEQIRNLIGKSGGDERWPVVINLLRNMTEINNYLLNNINGAVLTARVETMVALLTTITTISIICRFFFFGT